jgi:hypothetical protein
MIRMTRKIHRIQMKKYNIVKNAFSSGYCMTSVLPVRPTRQRLPGGDRQLVVKLVLLRA